MRLCRCRARDEILCCAGTQFDPEVAMGFLTKPESCWTPPAGASAAGLLNT